MTTAERSMITQIILAAQDFEASLAKRPEFVHMSSSTLEVLMASEIWMVQEFFDQDSLLIFKKLLASYEKETKPILSGIQMCGMSIVIENSKPFLHFHLAVKA